MERLTFKLDGRNSVRLDNTRSLTGVVADRLAAYEDTGLTPEEITDIISGCRGLSGDQYKITLFGEPLSHWQELFKEEEQGRLLRLPCKLGDTVWVLHMGFNANFLQLYQGYCVEISQSLLHGSAEESYVVNVIDFEARYYKSDIGSTLFFSQAEAEAAMKKRREDEK